MGKVKEYYYGDLEWLADAPMADDEDLSWLDDYAEEAGCEEQDKEAS